jgi:putative ABC transport system permease protein
MTDSSRSDNRFEAAYRRLLRVYPRAFRRRFEDEMVELFRTRRAAAAARGRAASAWFTVQTIGDVTRTLWRERPRVAAGAGNNARDAVRVLRRSPSLSITIALLMAATIGAATAVFSVVNAVLLKPLPYPHPERLAAVWEARPDRGLERGAVSGHEFPVWEEQNRVFERMTAITVATSTLTGAGDPMPLLGVRVTAGYFDVLGIRPAAGRGLLPEEDVPGRGQVIVISERLWRERFNADRAVVGRKILLDDRPFEVVGVMPEGAGFPPTVLGTRVEYWAPLAEPIRFYRGRHYLTVVGRLRAGVTLDQARADMQRVATGLAAQFPDLNRQHEIRVLPLHGDLVRDTRASLLLLSGAVACLLLIGASNVAGLLLARGLARRHEIGVRLAIGGTRLDVVRQLLFESLFLAALGAALGTAATVWFAQALPSLLSRDVLALDRVDVDPIVLGFALAVSVGTGLLFGLAPALQARNVDVADALGRAGRSMLAAGGTRLRSAVVVGQVALTLTLLLSAGVLTRELLTIQAVDPGYRTDGVLAVDLMLPGSRYAGAARQREFFADLAARTAAIPGVASVATTSAVPLSGRISGMSVDVEGRPAAGPGDELTARYRVVSADYFTTLGIPVVAGRTFAASDARIAVPLLRWYPQQPPPAGFDAPQRAPIAVINATMARRFWPDADPVGRRFRVVFSPWITVAGVVANTHNDSLREPPGAEFYLHDLQEPQSSMSLLVRAAGSPIELAPAVRSTIRALDANLAIGSTRTLDDVVRSTFGRRRLTSSLVGGFGLLALGLTAAGIYGVVAFSTAQRLPELGLRIALGAEPRQMRRLVVRQGCTIAAIGIAIGLALTLVLVRAAGAQVFDAPSLDPLTAVIVVALLIGAILAACWGPARRASRVDPVTALRAN